MLDHTAASPLDRFADTWRRSRPGLWRPGRQSRLLIAALGACLAAAAVGYETAVNPVAGPAHVAVVVRVLIIVTLVGVGLYAQTSKLQARMGRVLVGAGLFSVIWLLNGSSERLPFSLGVLASGAAPLVLCFVMLCSPSGRLEGRNPRLFLLILGTLAVGLWVPLVLTSPQPVLHTPLVRCLPDCPRNILWLGTSMGASAQVAKVLLWTLWAALSIGTAGLVWRRARATSRLARAAAIPVVACAVAMALIWLGFAIAELAASPLQSAFGAAYVEMCIVIPLAILSGLIAERHLLGHALADFVTGVAEGPRAAPEALMAAFLRDPSVKIGYWRPGGEHWVDRSGNTVDPENLEGSQTVSWVERGHVPVAVVIHDSDIADQERFVQAAGAAALLGLERAQLEVDLKASTRELAASRVRLVESADAERQRIERDLHDSIQQDLIALRLNLDMAAEASQVEPERGQRMILAVGRQLDEVLEALRALARGIYPSLLSERGVVEALKSVARRAPIAVSVDGRGVDRYREELEVAVYFCCLEALQNAIKHAGREAIVHIRLRDQAGWLAFEVADTGVGFDPHAVAEQHGLLNMRDRAEAVGGSLTVTSTEGSGTRVRGRVPFTSHEDDSDLSDGLPLMENLRRQYVR